MSQDRHYLTLDGLARFDAVVWVGVTREPEIAEIVRSLMLELPARVGQVLFPEWEGHTLGELVELLYSTRSRDIGVLLPYNNEYSGQLPVEWRMKKFPVPVSSRNVASLIPIKRESSAVYLGRTVASKNVRQLATFWQSSIIGAYVNLNLYVDKVPDDAQEFGESVRWNLLPEAPLRERFSIYAENLMYVSAGNQEISPLAPLEAMSAGCIPVLRDCGGHRAIVDAAGVGAVFHSFAELENRVKEIIRQAKFSVEQSEKARLYVLSHHSPDASVRVLCSLLCI